MRLTSPRPVTLQSDTTDSAPVTAKKTAKPCPSAQVIAFRAAAGLSIFLFVSTVGSQAAKADIWAALFNSIYQSNFQGIANWVNQQVTGLTTGQLGIFGPNTARQQASNSGQANNLYELNAVDSTLVRAIAEGHLGDNAQLAASNEITFTNTKVTTAATEVVNIQGFVTAGNTTLAGSNTAVQAAATDVGTVQGYAAQAANATATQDILRYMAQQNSSLADINRQNTVVSNNNGNQLQQILNTLGAMSNQQQQQLSIIAADHIHSQLEQTSLGALVTTSANTAKAVDGHLMNLDIASYSDASEAMLSESQSALVY